VYADRLWAGQGGRLVWIQAPDCAACTCSLARAADSSPTCSSATGPSAPSKSTPTVSACCSPDRPTGPCHASPCGTIAAPLTDAPGVDTSMSSAPDFPVSPGVSPASELASRTRATSGLTPTACYARFDPTTHCWKTSQLSLLTHTLEPYSGTWPAHGMMRSGQCWALQTWVLPTGGNASGYSLPTPRSQDAKHGSATVYELGRKPEKDLLHVRLARQEMWPTPTAHTQGDWQTFIQQRLNATTRQAWTEAGHPLPTGQGQLNPAWVEAYLMSWPLDWTGPGPMNPQTFPVWQQAFRTALTAYVPWGTDRCRCAPPSPGAC
jgi:hypothetical protein